MARVESSSIVWWRRDRSAHVELICIGHVGAGAGRFREWASCLPPGIDLGAVRLPGRERRFEEPLLRAMDLVVEEIVNAIEPGSERPLALFGHCSGALIAFETARRLVRMQRARPCRVFVATPPLLTRRDGRSALSASMTTRERVRRLGGTDPAILANAELFKLLEPVLAADFAVVDTYSFVPDPTLEVPICLILEGSQDREHLEALTAAWGAQTTMPLSVESIEADHFFTGAAWREVAEKVGQYLARD